MMVQDILNNLVIQHSNSPWASPIVLVKKKDGSFCFCIDYHHLNSVTKMDVFLLPRIDDTLDLLSRSKYITTLDLMLGYWQMQMDDASRLTLDHMSSWLRHSGCTMCLLPSNTSWKTVLAGLVRDHYVVYIDDILVVGEAHLENLQKVFDCLRQANLQLKPKKFARVPGLLYFWRGISTDPQNPKRHLLSVTSLH